MPDKQPIVQKQVVTGSPDDIVEIAGVSGTRRELENVIALLKKLPPVPTAEESRKQSAESQKQYEAWQQRMEAWKERTGWDDPALAQRRGEQPAHTPAPQKAKKRAKPRDSSTKDLLTIQGAADRAGVHYQTIRNWINSGQLESIKRGSTVRIPLASLLACSQHENSQRESSQHERGKASA